MKKQAIANRIGVLTLIFTLFAGVPAAFPGQEGYAMPADIDPSARYLIFLHNYYVEKNGVEGDCRYHEILKAFADSGFTVISEIRTGNIIPCEYGARVVNQVRRLVDSGVAPGNIVVAGHSKGGVIALCAAAGVNHPEIKYVIMAGCGIAAIQKLNMYPDLTGVAGRVLSIYAGSDKVAGSCRQAFSKGGKGLGFRELVIKSDAGHRLFFAPRKTWVSPVVDWIGQN